MSRLTIVGDALLDHDLQGDVERLCPEAPVPVVDDLVGSTRPGGAGLAALLAARDGHAVTLVTALADDVPGRELAEALWRANVELVDVGLRGATPQKVRVWGAGRLLLRLDHGDRRPGAAGPLTEEARAALHGAEAVLVSDYGRGLAGRQDLRAAIRQVTLKIPVVWDPHPRGAKPVPGVQLATPNRSEASAFAAGIDGDGLPATARRARFLRERWESHSVSVTLGREGALLVGPKGTPFLVPAEPIRYGDACGAGDRFAVSAAVALTDGALPEEVVERAVREATSFVAGGGASSVSLDSVEGVDPTRDEAGDVEAMAARVRDRGGTVVAAGGCFDILHAGHVALLEAARALGDCLIVLVNSDDSVRRLKGPGRPLVPEEDRVAVLRGLAAVDGVVVFEEDTPEAALARLRPHVFAKGADYSLDELPEAAVVESWGGQVVLLPYVAGRSTTQLIEEVQLRGAP